MEELTLKELADLLTPTLSKNKTNHLESVIIKQQTKLN